MSKILVVEDNRELVKIIREALETAGFSVSVAGDGLQALALHAIEPPDVIVLDWMLPKLDGIGFLQQLRQKSATPVLMLTARTEEIDRIYGLEVGADDYLTKPFSPAELIARIKAMLRRVELIRQVLEADRNSQSRQKLCRAGQILDLNAEAHLAYLAGQPLDLSRTEFDVLHLFLRHPGRAFSRTYLLDTLWGAEYVGGDRSIDNLILRLRKKLGTLGGEIETVWGIGYRLKPESK
jgi:DNA-binding response OmpR family regulator